MLDGIQITILQLGGKNGFLGYTILIISRSIPSAASKSAITPSLSGRMVLRLSWVFSCIIIAFLPTAIILLVILSLATIDGSSTTTWSLCIIKVFAVPRSIAISCVKKLNNPIVVGIPKYY